MPPVRPPRPQLVRPELGPALPALLRDRFGIAERTTVGVVFALVGVLAVLAVVLVTRDDGLTELVHREPAPAFTLLYDEDAMQVARPAPGELERVETRRGRVEAVVRARATRLPPYQGAAINGLAPVLLERRIDALRRQDETFELRENARTRVNGAPGYEIAYRTGPRGRQVVRREVLVVPDEEARDGVVLTLRHTTRGRRTAATRRRVGAARSVYRSFRFGTERP